MNATSDGKNSSSDPQSKEGFSKPGVGQQSRRQYPATHHGQQKASGPEVVPVLCRQCRGHVSVKRPPPPGELPFLSKSSDAVNASGEDLPPLHRQMPTSTLSTRHRQPRFPKEDKVSKLISIPLHWNRWTMRSTIHRDGFDAAINHSGETLTRPSWDTVEQHLPCCRLTEAGWPIKLQKGAKARKLEKPQKR